MVSTVLRSAPSVTLFLLAHNDDEFFALPLIVSEVRQGNRVICVFTTDGAAYGADPAVRHAESVAVLTRCGVAADDILPFGAGFGVRDGFSYRNLPELWRELRRLVNQHDVTKIFTLAWEGGHVDHDAAHLLGAATARTLASCSHFEFSAYNGFRCSGRLFRCMKLIPGVGEVSVLKIDLRQALRWLTTCRFYVTQRKAFLGLLPLCLLPILARREVRARAVVGVDYALPPHGGRLFYEKYFGVSFSEFLQHVQDFVGTNLR